MFHERGNSLPDRIGISRCDDERILRILFGWTAGRSLDLIAADEEMSRGAVAGLIRRVRLADVTESGEPAARIRASYDHG